MKKSLKTIAIALLGVVSATSIAVGVTACKKRGPVETPKNITTVRYDLPTDGSNPSQHSGIENIGYMATVLDGQPSYDVYAYNSTKAVMGYEQVTQSWKDYKNAQLSGIGQSVMVCSDLSYSMFVQSSTQSCFIGGKDAYMRKGKSPSSKKTIATQIEWSDAQPEYYDKDAYLYKYGEFSTELCVYAINADTLDSADDVVDNGDGTYTQKYYLKPTAACWYQYGMKTRGGFKDFPEYKKIEISFTFDSGWKVLSSYCEEKAKITPSALGGGKTDSNSKTTTTFDYTADGFYNENYAYFDNYYKQYVGVEITPPTTDDNGKCNHELLDVLAGGFGKVITEEGQQFALDLTIGETEYEGKLYAKLPNLEDILGSLEVRLQLGKKSSGKQDLFVHFKDGAVNAYYGEDFAMTADINKVASAVSNITEWINGFGAQTQAAASADTKAASLDIGSLLSSLDFSVTDDSAVIKLVTDDLLGLGIGADVKLSFTHNKSDDGCTFGFNNLDLKGIAYKGTPISLSGALNSDNSPVINRNASDTPADLADYINGVYEVLNSNSLKVDLGLNGLVEGLKLDATAFVKYKEGIAAQADLSVEYEGLTATLNAYYVYEGDYGKVYLNLTEFNGTEYDAKVYCDIKDAVDAVKLLIGSVQTASDEEENASSADLAEIINKVLNLNYAKILSGIHGNSSEIGLYLNADELLKQLDISLEIEIGTVGLKLVNEERLSLNAEVEKYGLDVTVSGSETVVVLPDTSEYVELVGYINSVYALLNSDTLKVQLGLDGLIEGLKLNATAFVNYKDEIATNVNITAEYEGISLALNAYYVYDGGYGKVYLNLTQFNGNAYDAKVYCDIADTVETVKQIIALFSTENTATLADEQNDILANAIAYALSLNYNEIIKADNTSLKATVDVDEILEVFGVSLGFELGKVVLTYNTNATLTASVEEIGLDLTVSGSSTKVEKPEGDYIDIKAYADSIYALLKCETLKVQLGLDKLIEGLKLNATAFVNYKDEIATNVDLTAEYEGITLALNAYYVYDGGYGKAYLNVTELNGNEYDIKVCCDIEKTVEAVHQILEIVNGSGSGVSAQAEESDILAKAIAYALSLNYNEIIKADNTSLKATVDVDEILEVFGVSLGFELGKVVLTYNTNATLTANVEKIGLDVTVSGSSTKVEKPTGEYVNINTYIDSLLAFVDSESYEIKLKLNGNDEDVTLSYVEGIVAEATVYVKPAEDFKSLEVKAEGIEVSYNGIKAVLNAYYVYDGGYGKVYLNLTELNNNEYDIKVYCDIEKTVEAVQQIMEIVNGKGTSTKSEEKSESKTIAQIITAILKIDYQSIITQFKGTNTAINATIDADEIIALFVKDFKVSFGKVSLTLNNGTAQDAKATLSGSVPALGLKLGIAGSDEEVKAPDDKGNYVNINSYVDSLFALMYSESYEIKLKLNGNGEDVTLSYVEGITAEATVYVKPAEDFRSVEVQAKGIEVSYNGIKAVLNAYYVYDGGYGKVYLNLTELNNNGYDIKVYCDIEKTVEAVQQIMEIVNGKGTSTKSGAGEKKTIAQIITAILKIDYQSIITQFKGTNTAINATIDADEIIALFVKDFKVSFGKVLLTLNNGTEDDARATLSGSVPAIGLKLGIAGSDEEVKAPDDKGNYVNINSYVDSLFALMDSESYEIKIDLDGTEEGVTLSYLNDAKVDATVYAKPASDFRSVEIKADMTVIYNTFKAVLNAYYVYDGGYGKVYLNLTELNGVSFDAKIYCDIKDTVDAVTELLHLINGTSTKPEEKGEKQTVAQIITAILKIDYPSIIKEFEGTNTAINATIDADEIIALFVEDFKVSFGKVLLTLNNGTEDDARATLSGSVPALGLKLGLTGSDEGIKAPDASAYINVTELVELVKKATVEAQSIIEAKDIVFEIDAEVIADGVSMKVKGNGEVSWIEGEIRVAIDVVLTIAENGKSDSVDVKLVYDETAEENEPLVRFAVNSYGMEIYRSDIDGLVNDFNTILGAVNNLINGNSAQTDSDSAESTENTESTETTEATKNEKSKVTVDEVFELINTENAQKILNVVLGFVSNLTVELQYTEGEQPDIYGLFIEHAINGKLELTSNGNLAIAFEINNNNGTKITGVSASVAVGKGLLIEDIDTILCGEDFTLCKSTETEKFIKVIYNYLFNLIDGKLSVSEVLGGKTYTVKLSLNGADSAIKEIEKISANATLYYTETLSGSKLAEAEVALNIGETAVELNVRYSERNIYIELINIMGTKLDGMKFTASTDEIYSAAETVVSLITSGNLAKIISRFAVDEGNEDGDEEEESTADEETKLAVTEILNKILNLDFNAVINMRKDTETGENVLTVNPDVVLGEFGIDVQIGTVTASVNPVTHKISANAQIEGNDAWLSLSAFADGENKRKALTTEEYIDINFVSTLLNDVSTTFKGIDAENIRLSFKGSVSINVYNLADVVFENVTLTVGIDENNEFFVTLHGDLRESKALLFVKVASESKVSLTYSHGYITLGRDVETSPKYRVVTLEYLIDNLLDSKNSPLFWWLGTSDVTSILNAIGINNDKLGLSSGLTKPESMYLYDLAQASNDDVFYLSSIISGFTVNTDGKPVTYNSGDIAVSGLKLKNVDRYYAFNVNGKDLTGGTVSTLYAAILRDSKNGGISGLKAYAEISNILKATINLDGGITDDHKPDYYKVFNGEAAVNGYTPAAPSNHTTPIFGMYDSQNNKYYSSDVLDIVTLKVVDENGVEKGYDLRYGSTVYLSSTFAPEWVDASKKYTYIYKDKDGNALGESITLDSEETVVYIYKIEDATEKKEIIYHTGVEGIGDVSAAFELRDGTVALKEYGIEGYILLGTYSDEAHTLPVTNAEAFEGNDVYCVYIIETVVVNGVKYSFDKATLTYIVSGFDSNAIAPYTVEGSVLVLESSVNGYPVNTIKEQALKGASLKNVVVPESIITVGATAFGDNYGIQSVTFLASKVELLGGKNADDKNGVFYGCSVSDGGETTILKVYYTELTAGNAWTQFRRSGTIFTSDYYIGRNGGATISSNWAFINYEIVSVNNDKAVEVGSVSFPELAFNATSVKSADDIANYVNSVLNGVTYGLGYINAFEVKADRGVELNQTMYTITITVKELAEDEWYYLLTVESAVEGLSSAIETVDGNYEVVEGLTYVQTGATVTVTSSGDDVYNTFGGWTSSNENLVLENTTEKMTFTMPVGVTEVTSSWKAVFAENIYVYSEVAFTYNGVEYGVDGAQITNAAVGKPLADAKAVESSKYTFVGWALVNGENLLEFVEVSSVQSYEVETTYYAIWVVNREEIEVNGKFASGTTDPNADNSGLSVSVDTSKVKAFHKWYADSSFATELESFTTSTTVLYARMTYSFTYTLSGNGDTYFYVNNPGDDSSLTKNNATSNSKSYSNTVDVLEGVTVSYSIENDNQTIILNIGDDTVNLRAKKRGGWSISNAYAAEEMRKYTLETLTGNWINNTVKVDSNLLFLVTF